MCLLNRVWTGNFIIYFSSLLQKLVNSLCTPTCPVSGDTKEDTRVHKRSRNFATLVC